MKKVTSLIVVLFMIFTMQVSASTNSVQPPIEEIKQIISETAIKYDIPPEILKAIAFVESGYKQFDDGEPFVSDDGGIGIMQVTPDNIDMEVDIEKLKFDIKYNIEIGAQVLNSKWGLSYLPKLNDSNRHVLENWYFPIAAYNGLSKVNDPNLNPNNTYQEKIYKRIEGSSLIYWNKSYFQFPKFDIRYEDGNETMKFPPGVSYQTETITPTQQMYESGDLVYVDNRDGAVTLRSSLDINSVSSKLLPFTPVQITGSAVESSSINNDFSYYPLKGITANGFISSAYLNKGNEDFTFTDPQTDDRAAALYFMAMNGYITGYPNGSFGSNQNLTREHVALILDRILDMEMPSNYQLKAADVSTKNLYYEEIKKAEYNGYLGVGGKIRPRESLSRSQMASVLVRAFGDYYKEPTTNHTFKDQKSLWNYDDVNTLYNNNVTVADPFLPDNYITRSQFALFIYRTMVNQ